MPRVQILLSTYNGEKYLRPQLDSFLALENAGDISVLIRDDGSTDGTREILEEYRDRHGFSLVFGDNIGFVDSMTALFSMADMSCDYFAFSDQDDVWLPDKLSRAVEALDRGDNTAPLLYAALSYLVDAELHAIGQTMTPKKPPLFYNAMVQNVCPGHTQVANHALMALLRREKCENILVPDFFVYMLASATGRVIFDATPTTLYRQHGGNVIGYRNGFFRNLGTRLKRMKTDAPKKGVRQLLSLVTHYRDVMKSEYLDEARRFFFCGKNFFTRLGYMFSAKAYRQSLAENLIFRGMYLIGKYKIKSLPKDL